MKKLNKLKIVKNIYMLGSSSILLSSIFLMTSCKEKKLNENKKPITNQQKKEITEVLNTLKNLSTFSITKDIPLSEININFKKGIEFNEYIQKIENYFENLYTLNYKHKNIDYTFTINLFGEITTCKYNNTLIDIKDFSKDWIIIFKEKQSESINYKKAKLYNWNNQSKILDKFKKFITIKKKEYNEKINKAKLNDSSQINKIKQIINGIESSFQSSYDFFVKQEIFN